MNKILDLEKAPKKMPYTTPEGFFDELEDRVWREVKGGFTGKETGSEADGSGVMAAAVVKTLPRRPSKLRLLIGGAVAVAASVALVFTIGLGTFKRQTYTVNDVDQAFSQLNSDDQAFLLSVYQDDVFINE